MTPTECFVGIDVSKAHLDVACRPQGSVLRFDNTEAGVAELVSHLRAVTPTLVVLEATGGLQTLVVAALALAGIPTAVVNPRQVRDFARALGRLAKTDALDADTLAHFAATVRPQPRPLPEADAQALQALLLRRRQLLDIRVAESNRLPTAVTDRVRGNVQIHIDWLTAQVVDLD